MAEEIFSDLSRFGLSNYEIKLYRALLIYGPNTPTGAVKIAGVPQPRVYDLFNSLQEKGFVDVVMGKKHLYRAVPVETVMQKEILWIDSYAEELNKYVENNAVTIPVKDPYIWFVKGNSNVEDRIKSMVYSAKYEIIMALSYKSYKYVSGIIQTQLKKGVTVGIVLFNDTPEKALNEISDEVILKYIDGKPLEMVMIDRTFVLSNLKGGIDNSDYAIYLEEDQLLHALSYYFYYEIWGPAKYLERPEKTVYYKLTNIWFTCDIIDHYLENGIKLKGDLQGVYRNEEINITGNIIRTERVNGQKQSFYMSSGDKLYSVGGKSAIYEDIKLISIVITREISNDNL